MSIHPFTVERENALREGINALNDLGYFKTACAVGTVLDEQLRARAYREGNRQQGHLIT